MKEKDINKIFYIFATKYSLSLMNSLEIQKYLVDCIYKCIKKI